MCILCVPVDPTVLCIAGILPLRCQLFTRLGMEKCPLAMLLPGALGKASLLKRQVMIKVRSLVHTV